MYVHSVQVLRNAIARRHPTRIVPRESCLIFLFCLQVTDYSHVLDPWGHSLGLEVGRQCLYGATNIKMTIHYKYCSKIWGIPAVNLIFANRYERVYTCVCVYIYVYV